MKQIVFNIFRKALVLFIFLTQFNLKGYSQSGLDKNGRVVSEAGTMINKNGAIGSGSGITKDGKSFSAAPVLATLTTTTVTSIVSSAASGGGEITNAGNTIVTARGVVWSTSSSPTIVLTSKTIDGTGSGTFISSINGLLATTTYYIRAYATNSVGTSYGNEKSFTTVAPPPYMVDGNAICDGTFSTAVVEVTGPSGAIWMDRNLGASRAATSPTDYFAYGCLYQWGRGNDGHASIKWTGATSGDPVNGITTTLSTTDTPDSALFIKGVLASNYDWRSTQNNNLWQGQAGLNNPCPSGFRIPTLGELEANIFNDGTFFSGSLKLTLPGNRSYQIGNLNNTGVQSAYFSSTVSQWSGRHSVLTRTVSATYVSNFEYGKTSGYPVRCIKQAN
jgi:hypothetical protein